MPTKQLLSYPSFAASGQLFYLGFLSVIQFFWDKTIIITALFIEVYFVPGTLLSVSHVLIQSFLEATEFSV